MPQKGHSHIVRLNEFADWQLEELINVIGRFKHKSNYLEYLIHHEFQAYFGPMKNPFVKIPLEQSLGLSHSDIAIMHESMHETVQYSDSP